MTQGAYVSGVRLLVSFRAVRATWGLVPSIGCNLSYGMGASGDPSVFYRACRSKLVSKQAVLLLITIMHVGYHINAHRRKQ